MNRRRFLQGIVQSTVIGTIATRESSLIVTATDVEIAAFAAKPNDPVMLCQTTDFNEVQRALCAIRFPDGAGVMFEIASIEPPGREGVIRLIPAGPITWNNVRP